MKKIYLLALFGSIISTTAQADFTGYGIQLQCMPELNLLVVRNEFYPGYIAEHKIAEAPKDLQTKYNIYTFKTEEIVGRKEVNVYPKQYNMLCQLSNHKIEVKIEPNPETFILEPNSYCPPSVNITVKDNGKVIAEKLNTADCDRDIILSNFMIHPQADIPNYNNSGALIINGYNGVRMLNEKFYYDRLGFEPITNFEFYKNYEILPPEK